MDISKVDEKCYVPDDTLSHGSILKTHKGVYTFGILAALGGCSVGYDTGAVSSIMTMGPFIDRFMGDASQQPYRSGLLVALMLLTATLGGLLSGNLCDAISRKYTILLGTLTFALGCLFETIGYNFALMLVGRLFVGFGQGFLTNAIPLYHSEIAPPAIRGRLITLFSATCSIGIVVGYFISFGTNYLDNDWCWRAPFLIHLVLCVVISFAYILPFSPRWLIDKGRYDEARQVIASLYQCELTDEAVTEEFNVVLSEIQHERAFGNRTYAELFRGTNLRRTLFALFAGNGAAFTGTSGISYYSPQIMEQAGLNGTGLSLVASGASNIVGLIFTMVALAYIDRVGRKFIFASGAFIMGATMYIVGALFQAYYITMDDAGDIGLGNLHARNCVIAFIFIFQAAYAYSWGPVGYIYPAEILNQRTRAKGLALAYGLNWAISIFMTFVMPIFMSNTVYGGYYFFGATCSVLFFGVFLMPETKGYTLEEIDRMFNPKVDMETTSSPLPKESP
ncbi:general substrate transporter [Halteromyces radiatus]|uniref:general substrate transporter n=1 Tax=Halteromyces radiatus TaxID=101107 RepID=UPI0022203798|nr:general substrate transporter [Halteromyces radiatus]KAI8096227.1 general substrate transporter [Halteromyces radiatus]